MTEAIRAIPLAVSLLVGQAQGTPSDHLKPMPDLYRVAGQSDVRSSALEGDHERRVPLAIDEVSGTSTGDAGAKIRGIGSRTPWETGGRLYIRLPQYGFPDATERRFHFGAWTAAQRLPEHARAVVWMVDEAGLSAGRIGNLVGASRVRVQQWKTGAAIGEDHLRRLMETRDILRRAMRQRPSKEALATWLVTPDPHEGVSPEHLLRHEEFERARLLAVLSPSGVEPLPSWAKRPVAEAWRTAKAPRQRPGEFVDE